ncbi:MAG: lipopolysaccharide heptosyltransferase I [endosymbiont of Seepiophila jonesi]|uniref:Lipopolysaccharide heptosyltransferase 1 n=1 Tax=endosymbiont of Lamellibrachia luymesi TaxID=2200907 RepID=A0A370DYD2_9GAMM|nr:MAG: lipopolysaccharide heptosyltransferase I [endosymbiont of Seepiophila jonesi]RDH91391.1 MAG: lipopolysaccharide heptosyltransferase I [endosymbiont of Lamellibrachia luymesi]
MRVLVIKTSSLGDVVHTLPALTDAAAALPDIRFDWVVEEAFAEIPAWHPAVDKVIPVAMRRWRRSVVKTWRNGEWRAFKSAARARRYDAVIDAQGLLKSAFITVKTHGPRFGLDQSSAREPLAALAYSHPLYIPKGLHAITRVRQLFAHALGYPMPGSDPDYGIDGGRFQQQLTDEPYLLLLHGTTWQSKHYPEQDWRGLIRLAGNAGLKVFLPWGSDVERQRAGRLSEDMGNAEVLPKLDLAGLAGVIAGARGVAAVDTGLAHLTGALGVPAVILYGPTRPSLTGVVGESQVNLEVDFDCAPCLKRTCVYAEAAGGDPVCFDSLAPETVFARLAQLMSEDAQIGTSSRSHYED